MKQLFTRKLTDRTKIVKYNAIGSLLIKACSSIIDFAKVPMLLSYLDSERYGIYVTISAIVYWSHNFDFGLGAGLRYKLTESLSIGDQQNAKQLVSTAYISMSVLMAVVFMCFTPIGILLDWQKILNSQVVTNNELLLCVIFVFAIYLIQFVLELISYVVQADQKSAFSMTFKPIANALTLILLFLFNNCGYNSLFGACLAMCVPIVVVLLCVNVGLYYKLYATIAPSWTDFSFSKLRDIYSLGFKFFLDQIVAFIIFNTASIMLTHYVDPTETTLYNVSWTYFGIIVMLNNMMLQPLVAAVTDAYVKDEHAWIRNIFLKIKLYSIGLTFISLFMLIISPYVFDIWLGHKVNVPMPVSIMMTMYFILNIWTVPYKYILSGVGKMYVTTIWSIIKVIVYIPSAIILVKSYGIYGLILAITFMSTLPDLIIGFIQYNLIVNKKARGIWNK